MDINKQTLSENHHKMGNESVHIEFNSKDREVVSGPQDTLK